MDMLKAMLFSQKAEMLGNSLTVELRTLTPSVLVRIQVPQPIYLLEKDYKIYFPFFCGEKVRHFFQHQLDKFLC